MSDDAPTSASYSHPDRPVRHSYPLAIEDAGLSTAFGLLMRTSPYAMARFFALLTVSVVTIIWYVLTFGGLIFLGSKVHPIAGYAWLFGGLGIYGYVWRTVVRYFLYLLKAGHIAVLTELLTKGSIGSSNEGMFEHGKRIVTERFGQVNAMFALDLLVHGVVRAFNRTLTWIANLIPIPGLSGITSIVKAIVFSATTFVDETIFSYSLARGDDNVFRSSQDGLLYYAQNSKEVLKTGVWIVILDKLSTFFTWLLMLIPATLVTWILPASIQGIGGFGVFLVAALLAWNLRAAFLEPLFLIMIMTKFHVCARGQAIDAEWDERLSSVSKQFVELKDKIAGGARPAQEPAPAVLPAG